jgi:hypothetical protein
MSWLKSWMRWRNRERELDDELRAYVELVAEEYRGRGYAPADAMRAARVEAGAVEVTPANSNCFAEAGIITGSSCDG